MSVFVAHCFSYAPKVCSHCSRCRCCRLLYDRQCIGIRLKWSRPAPQIMTFVFPAFTLNPFFSMASFHINYLRASRESAMMTRSSAYRSSQGTLAENSRDKASSTMMKSKGLSTNLWWTLTFTTNSWLKPSPK